jgi:hypothetical protein
VWRYHKEIGSLVERGLEDELKVPAHVRQEDTRAMEWVPAHKRIEKHASVSMDGVKVRIRGDGFREVKIASVSEVIENAERSEGSTRAMTKCERNRVEEEDRAIGNQENVKLVRHSYRAILGDKERFIPAVRGELACRRVRQADRITAVNDGAEWIWDLVKRFLPERTVEILDWPHAVENLAKAANAGWGEGTEESQAWLEERRAELWAGELVQVQIGLHDLPIRYKGRGRAIRQVKDYVDQHYRRLHYDRFREDGRPIGSGTVESAARNVVTWRMKRGGQRWSPAGAQRMLATLGEVHSNRWDTRLQRFPQAA